MLQAVGQGGGTACSRRAAWAVSAAGIQADAWPPRAQPSVGRRLLQLVQHRPCGCGAAAAHRQPQDCDHAAMCLESHVSVCTPEASSSAGAGGLYSWCPTGLAGAGLWKQTASCRVADDLLSYCQSEQGSAPERQALQGRVACTAGAPQAWRVRGCGSRQLPERDIGKTMQRAIFQVHTPEHQALQGRAACTAGVPQAWRVRGCESARPAGARTPRCRRCCLAAWQAPRRWPCAS